MVRAAKACSGFCSGSLRGTCFLKSPYESGISLLPAYHKGIETSSIGVFDCVRDSCGADNLQLFSLWGHALKSNDTVHDEEAQARAAHTPHLISVRGARTHNLKNIDVDIPRAQLVVITGLSGSGKSSLAFDTLYAEGQRRYVESLSAYARQFLNLMPRPEVDFIDGLSPAISISQHAGGHNPRSTVGTVTEIHDWLRLLFARAGVPHCPEHGHALHIQTVAQMVAAALALPDGARLMLLAPLARAQSEGLDALLEQWQARGYVRFRIDGQVVQAAQLDAPLDGAPHDVDIVIDRLRARADAEVRLAESFEAALAAGGERALLVEMDTGEEHSFSTRFACPECGYTLPALEPRMFSFNAPQGACPACGGLGVQDAFDPGRVLAFPCMSLPSGAVAFWDARNADTRRCQEALAAHYGFDLDEPFERLPQRVQHAVLHGSGEELIDFGEDDGRHPFEGVLPMFERRWRAASPSAREQLSRLRTHKACPACGGARLARGVQHVFIGEGEQRRAIHEVSSITLEQAQEYFATLQLKGARGEIAARVVQEIASRLRFLCDVGLGYLNLARSATSLSGGEAQRIRLASQIGSALSGVMYVLDEPSIGLHQRDNARLIGALRRLRDAGNSVLVVEHDADMMRAADHIIDLGPGAGVHGGRVMAQGSFAQVAAAPDSPTGQYLSGRRAIAVPAKRRKPKEMLRVVRASGHNLRGVTADFPLGLFTCVTGVSGSGKSTLVQGTLLAAASRFLMRARVQAAPHEAIDGLERLDKVIAVDQSPIGRTPRSNPATYTGLFAPIRALMAASNDARERGWGAGRFSFNVPRASGGGRCEACQGEGMVRVPMHFLPDAYVPCDACGGSRYSRETLQVLWKGCNIAQILGMTVSEAADFFRDQPTIARTLGTLLDVGLGYITLGQSATTLSGGEAQRLKLALELARPGTGRTLYVLDEPTTGLHFADVQLLLAVLMRLRDAGNTIVVIEHNLDLIKCADWLVDLGPEGGAGGGQLIVQGTPEDVAACAASHTGRCLAPLLGAASACKKTPKKRGK